MKIDKIEIEKHMAIIKVGAETLRFNLLNFTTNQDLIKEIKKKIIKKKLIKSGRVALPDSIKEVNKLKGEEI